MSHDPLSKATFTRASIATFNALNSAKDKFVLKTGGAAVDVARDAHYHSIGVKGLLLEGSRSNVLQRSEELDNAYWTKNSCTVSANAAAGPDGLSTADEIVEDATASVVHELQRDLPTLANSTNQPFTVFAKANTRTFLRIRTTDKGNTVRHSWVNLTTGAQGTKDAGHTMRISPEIETGWYRVEIVFDSATGGTTPQVAWGPSDADNSTTYNGDGSSGIYSIGPQFETDGLFASSYIKTTSATATRSADKIEWPYTTVPQCATFYLHLVDLGTGDITAAHYGYIGDDGATEDAVEVLEASGNVRMSYKNSTTVTSDGGNPAIGNFLEIRGVLFPGGEVQMHTSVDEAAETSGTKSAALALPTAWGTTKIWLNRPTDGFAVFLKAKVAFGVQTLAFMRDF